MQVTDAAVRGMVDALRPSWRVDGVERSAHGTDFVAALDVRTPEGSRRAVLKATTADLVDPVIARSEPRLLELVGRETGIPVPRVFGYCDDHGSYPAPFYLMSYEEGVNFEEDAGRLPTRVRERIVREAGRNLAELHLLGPLPASGRVGVRDGELAVLDTGEHPRYDDFREHLLADVEDTLDALAGGGFFPELADDPSRFADLVPDLGTQLRETIPALPSPDPPTYCHWDYRYGNLLVDPETGATRAVLDWANLSAADPAYNLATAEFHLLDPGPGTVRRRDDLRETFRGTYAGARGDWTFDAAVRERMAVYRLVSRLDAMACLPLWYRDESAEVRDRRAAEHRAFVSGYL